MTLRSQGHPSWQERSTHVVFLANSRAWGAGVPAPRARLTLPVSLPGGPSLVFYFYPRLMDRAGME